LIIVGTIGRTVARWRSIASSVPRASNCAARRAAHREEAAQVRQRRDVQHDVGRVDGGELDHQVADAGREAALAAHDALGLTGRAGGVGQPGQRLGIAERMLVLGRLKQRREGRGVHWRALVVERDDLDVEAGGAQGRRDVVGALGVDEDDRRPAVGRDARDLARMQPVAQRDAHEPAGQQAVVDHDALRTVLGEDQGAISRLHPQGEQAARQAPGVLAQRTVGPPGAVVPAERVLVGVRGVDVPHDGAHRGAPRRCDDYGSHGTER